jgi:Zn-dependent metalloprotease
VLRHVVANGDPAERQAALDTLVASERLRAERTFLAAAPGPVPAGEKRRTIYDAKHLQALPGARARGEGEPASADAAVNEAYDGLGAVHDFYAAVLSRSSVDGQGARLDASVHFGRRYDNAFWNGRQMVFGDGDGVLFRGFTACLEVIGHELAHGVIQHEAALEYRGEPGALNESFADVLGVLVKQWSLRQTAAEASWLVGEGLLGPKVRGVALRSMKAPGTAYDDPRLGRDPQPAHYRDLVRTEEDDGGVHLNSGIPNRAFYLAATAFGGHAWERAGAIWYDALCDGIGKRSTFATAARVTAASARGLFGREAEEVVRAAWAGVGVAAPERRS